MKVTIESILPCSPDQAWEEVQTSELLREIASPLIYLEPAAGHEIPQRWHTDQTVQLRPYLFGFIPMGTRTLYFERVDAERREFQTREFDPLIRRWDHLVRIE